MNVNLNAYRTQNLKEYSLYKGIPIQYLAEVQEFLKLQYAPLGFRYRFRGSRTNPLDTRTRTQRNQQCLRKFASTFAVYYRVKANGVRYA